jgi:hypothetical protein
MTRWRRVSPVNFPVVIAGVIALICGALTAFLVIQPIISVFQGKPYTWGVLIAIAFVGVFAFVSFRMSRRGVWISDRGLRDTTFLGSRTFAWADIDRFEVRADEGLIGGLYNTDALWVVRKNGRAFQTVLVFRGPTYDSGLVGAALDTHLGLAEVTGLVPSPSRARRVMDQLEQALLQHS